MRQPLTSSASPAARGARGRGNGSRWAAVIRPLWGILRPALDAYEVTYACYWRPGLVGPALRVDLRRYVGPSLSFPDGTVVEPGDLIGEMHLQNESLEELHAECSRDLDGSAAVALRFRAMIVRSLEALAREVAQGRAFDGVKAFHGETIYFRGAERLGFVVRESTRYRLGPTNLFLHLLRCRFIPAGLDGLPAVLVRPRHLWLTRRELCRRYGPGAARAAETEQTRAEPRARAARGAGRLLAWLGTVHRLFSVTVLGALVVLLLLKWQHVRTGLRLVATGSPLWMAGAALAIALLYGCRAAVFGASLRVLGRRVERRWLWGIALAASVLHQLVPAAGLTGYAFITYALGQRGVPTGHASLCALVDTLSYASVMALLVLAGLAYMLLTHRLAWEGLSPGLWVGLAILAAAMYVWHAQRDQGRLTRRVLAWQRKLGELLGRPFREASTRRVLEQYFSGKQVVRAHPGAFLRMMLYQLATILLDLAALVLSLRALGARAPLEAVFLGFVLAMTVSTITTLPGGGGTFEATLAALLVQNGVATGQAVGVVLLYRLVAFWLPLVASVGIVARVRQRRLPQLV